MCIHCKNRMYLEVRLRNETVILELWLYLFLLTYNQAISHLPRQYSFTLWINCEFKQRMIYTVLKILVNRKKRLCISNNASRTQEVLNLLYLPVYYPASIPFLKFPFSFFLLIRAIQSSNGCLIFSNLNAIHWIIVLFLLVVCLLYWVSQLMDIWDKW